MTKHKIFKVFRLLLVAGLLFSALPAGRAQAATLNVCPSGCTYSSIQAAIDAAADGDVIEVADGTYDKTSEGWAPGSGDVHLRLLDIRKPITLRAANDGNGVRPVIDGSDINAAIRVKPSYFQGGQILIEGFEIRGNSSTGAAIMGDFCASDNPPKVIIQDNLITGALGGLNFWANADCSGSLSSSTENFEIKNNTFTNLGASGAQGYGIAIENLSSWAEAGNTYAGVISGNSFSHISSAGSNPMQAGVGVVVNLPVPSKPGSANVHILSNNFGANMGANIGIFTADANGAKLEKNNLSNGALGVYNGSPAGTADASSNWWGAGTGPAAGSIVGNVNYSPWCGNAACSFFVAGTDLQASIDATPAGGTLFVPDIYPDDTPDYTTGAASGYGYRLSGQHLILADGVIIKNALGGCFELGSQTVSGDHSWIMTESPAGAKCIPSGGHAAILSLQQPVDDIVVDGLEIDGSGERSGSAFYFNAGGSNIMILNNYVHDLQADGLPSTLLEYHADITGEFVIQGNLFKGTAGMVDMGNWDTTATYNSWGAYTVTPEMVDYNYDGSYELIHFEPYTHAAIVLTPSKTTPVAVGSNLSIDVIGVLKNITAATFTLEYDPDMFEFVRITDATTEFTPGPDGLIAHTSGQVKFDGWAFPAVSSPTEEGTLLYKLTLKALEKGNSLVSINPANDQFGMMPPSGPSNNVYAASLDSKTITAADPLEVTGADIKISKVAAGPYDETLPGNLADGFTMSLDGTTDWVYLDTDTITSNRPLKDGSYSFYLAGSAPAQEVFQLVVSNSGTEFFLRDAYLNDGTPLRVRGNDPLGTYTFVGTVKDDLELTAEVSIKITFVDPFTVTNADLKFAYVPEGPYQAVGGSYAAGFDLYVDPTVAWYYLDSDVITSSHDLKDGLYPFHNVSDPSHTPVFYVKVAGTDISLIDAFLLAHGAGEQPLRINGDAAPGTYTFSGELKDEYGLTTKAEMSIKVIDAVAYVQANTSLSGNLDHLIATFPPSIPDVIVHEPYKINSRMTLGAALPAGTKVSIEASADGITWVPYVTDVTLPGASFWITDLFSPAPAPADFDANYGGKVEHYRITVKDSPVTIDTTLKVESIISKDGFTTEVVLAALEDIPVLFVKPLVVTETDLWYSETPGGTYTQLAGSLAGGFVMKLDPEVAYYYLDTNTITANNPLKDGSYPFYIKTSPAGFFDYWATRGVVEGATEPWQIKMWEIINGRDPMFWVKVDGSSYSLIDGLQGGNNPLRINGSYFTGEYTYTGSLTDKYDTSDAFDIKVTFTRENIPTVTGTVSMQGRTTRSGILVTLSGGFGYGPYSATSGNQVSGNIVFSNLGLGEYVITVVHARYLDVTLALDKKVSLTTLKHLLAALELKAGDANDDNEINTSDASIVGSQYNTGNINSAGDVNFDNKVNIQDLALIGSNWGKTSADVYASWTP